MKTILLFLCLVAACCRVAPAAELLWADFDTSPTGSVANLPGWTRASWLGGITARVDNVGAYVSPSNVLELPWNATASSAVFANFNSTYTTNEHPVIRCSAKLVAPSNAFFQLGLRNAASGAFLAFQPTNNFGGFGFLAHDWIIFPLVHDRFVDVAFFYNRSNNHYRLDYDYTNRIPWITNSEGGATVSQFNQFVVSRPSGTASTTGSFLVDDVSVETFPPYVWAWWRCDSTRQLIDHLGAFMPTQAYASAIQPGASDPVWDGTADFHNEGSTRMFVADNANCAIATPTTSNWTLETVFRANPEESLRVSFLDWSRGLGFSTNGAWISFGYAPETNAFYFNLRDAEQVDGVELYKMSFGALVPDGRWHHVALVKSNAALRLYLDYQSATNLDLTAYAGGTSADGTYAFNSLSQAAIGRTLGNGNHCGPHTFIDEIRFSGKALALSEFLQPGQPMIVAIDNSPTGAVWQLTMKGVLGKSYRLETSPVFGPGASWQSATGLVANYTFNYVDVPTTVPRSNFVRLVREN